MSVMDAVSQGRAAAEARMSAACIISTDGTPVYNPTTEVYDETPATVYSGKCRVKMTDAMATRPDAGATVGTILRVEVDIPADTTGVAKNQDIVITSSQFSPSLVGVALQITNIDRHEQATALRLRCTEAQ